MVGSAFAVVLAAAGFIKAPYIGAVSADASNGRVLFSDNARAPAYPASLAKLMTSLLVIDDIRAGRYAISEMVTVTADVAASEPTWIGLKAGDRMRVKDLLTALIVVSANDAAVALAVHSAGSIDGFVRRMNERARSLGMNDTRYYSPSGLPPNARRKYPWKSFNVSTAMDQLKLALEIVKHDVMRQFTSVKTCDLVKTPAGYRMSVTCAVGKKCVATSMAKGESLVRSFVNHNNVMVKDALKIINPDGTEAVDGLKTGYINAGGSSVILSGRRRNSRALVVVLGSGPQKDRNGKVVRKGSAVRDQNAAKLMADALGSLDW